MTAVRVKAFRRDGLTFDVVDEGPRDGPVVLLLHGFPQRARSWAKVTPLLHAAGYRTIAPDQRGYSRGARPRGRRAYTMEHLVDDVAALVAAIGGPVHLVGHDWGSAVAWSVAASRPELVRTLTSVSVPHPEAMVRSWRTWDQLRRSWYMLFFQFPWLPELLLGRRRVSHRAFAATGMDRGMLAAFDTEIVGDGALTGALNWYRAMPLSDPRLLRGRVRVPTTHVWSDADEALGRRGADLTASYVDGDYRLEVLPGVSHWIPEQAPERLAEIILQRIG